MSVSLILLLHIFCLVSFGVANILEYSKRLLQVLVRASAVASQSNLEAWGAF